jgi:hypothetical protein
VTPIQMALVASTVANDGVLMKPRVVTELTGEGSGAREIGPETWRRVMSEDDARALQAAMQQAVEGELGRQFTPGAKVDGVPTAAHRLLVAGSIVTMVPLPSRFFLLAVAEEVNEFLANGTDGCTDSCAQD